ncbi:MAG TPA: methionyl-tRNA formyltransferase [Anaerolineales bacterium]|nr:methionyl-tRNA formyltransferase [Anaerolineales bacterium]
MQKYRVVFMGSPDFAVPALRALADHPAFALVGVVSQPDRPAGRGAKMQACPVKSAALDLGLETFSPESLRLPQSVATLTGWSPDVIVVAAYGQILRRNVLEMPRFGCVNIHASLLPRWRGAAPIAAAILQGDSETGISLMKMDVGLDTGAVFARQAIPILPSHTTASLTSELAQLGAELLVAQLPAYLQGELPLLPQDEQFVTYQGMLTKQDGFLDWHKPAVALARQVRAFDPWPSTFTLWQNQPLKVLSAVAVDANVPLGKVVLQGKSVWVGAGRGALQLQLVQPAGKRAMPALDFVRGNPAFLSADLSLVSSD